MTTKNEYLIAKIDAKIAGLMEMAGHLPAAYLASRIEALEAARAKLKETT